MKTYLDHAATTPVDLKVKKAMQPYLSSNFGNASSIHSFGQKAREAVDASREKIAKIINCSLEEIIFTSGGTEADNLAIKGLVDSVDFKPHLIVSRIEHYAVLKTVEQLEKSGRIEVTYARVDKRGKVDPNEVKKAIKKNTVLVSIMYVNNETGVIQSIREIGKMLEKIRNSKSEIRNKSKILNSKFKNYPYFHTDAVQAAGYLNLNVDYLHVDLMTLSAHKVYGPKGVGLLYKRERVPITSQITGGEQENGYRAGTENVAGVVGMAKALQITNYKLQITNRIKKLRDYFENKIKKEIKDVQINGDFKNRAPHISNISFKGAEGEAIIISLDLEGIAVSTGSACTSGSLEPSYVLLAMGVKPIDAQSSIRFSLGKENTKEQIEDTINKLKPIIERLRKISAI